MLFLVALIVPTCKFVPAIVSMTTYLGKGPNILDLVQQVLTHLWRLNTVLVRLVLILMMPSLFSRLSRKSLCMVLSRYIWSQRRTLTSTSQWNCYTPLCSLPLPTTTKPKQKNLHFLIKNNLMIKVKLSYVPYDLWLYQNLHRYRADRLWLDFQHYLE